MKKKLYPVSESVLRGTIYYEETSEAGELIRINNDGSITPVSEIIDMCDKKQQLWMVVKTI